MYLGPSGLALFVWFLLAFLSCPWACVNSGFVTELSVV